LERIVARVSMSEEHVFPSEELLDHIPLLIDGVADHLEHPAYHVGADIPVIAKAMELGALRHAQGTGEYQLLKEYEILGGILFTFLGRVADEVEDPCSRSELVECAHRVYHAVALIQQATVTHYLRLMREQVRERESRLRIFNRALTHEMKNQIGAALGAVQLLELEGLAPEKRDELAMVAERGLVSMRDVLANLVELSTLDGDRREQRHVTLPRAAAEAARELRDMAAAGGVAVRLGALPSVEVSAAAVELALVNYISNAIKYADPAKPERWVDVLGQVVPRPGGGASELVVEVRDNGRGVPAEHRERLFERGYRAHPSVAEVEGMGLGLSIVREAMETMGGRTWAEFPDADDVSSVFYFALPCRREEEDRPVAGRE
ncbi:MAG: sensor histidine kinase, partial [Gemmatimonadaceae bacterium]